jgi:hypothetical protein
MDDRYSSDADCVARARNLIARAAKGVEQLENVWGLAFCRLAALKGLLARLEELARSCDPDAIDAALLYAATVCREAEVLLRSLDSGQWGPARVAANGKERPQAPALLGSGLASGG